MVGNELLQVQVRKEKKNLVISRLHIFNNANHAIVHTDGLINLLTIFALQKQMPT